jgi:hypothetical protein
MQTCPGLVCVWGGGGAGGGGRGAGGGTGNSDLRVREWRAQVSTVTTATYMGLSDDKPLTSSQSDSCHWPVGWDK